MAVPKRERTSKWSRRREQAPMAHDAILQGVGPRSHHAHLSPVRWRAKASRTGSARCSAEHYKGPEVVQTVDED